MPDSGSDPSTTRCATHSTGTTLDLRMWNVGQESLVSVRLISWPPGDKNPLPDHSLQESRYRTDEDSSRVWTRGTVPGLVTGPDGVTIA
jgi:hypothetical protein